MAKGSLTSTVNGMTQSGFGFNAADRSSNVLEYYQPQLKTSGFDIKQSVAAGESGILVAESGGRTVTATVGGSGEKPNVSLMAIQQQ